MLRGWSGLFRGHAISVGQNAWRRELHVRSVPVRFCRGTIGPLGCTIGSREASLLNWDDLRYVLAIHRCGTLTQAAVALKINPTTAGRRLAALEEALGTRLFDRTPDGFSVTAAGRRLLPAAERMEREMLALERDIAGGDQKLEGVVRVTATEMLSTRFLAPYLGRLRARHPAIDVELLVTSVDLDLGRREADISLRLSRPKQEGLLIKRLADIQLALYGARSYFQCRADAGVGDEEPHDLLAFAKLRGFARENDWLKEVLPDARVSLRSSSVSSVYAACTAGLGIALLPHIVADRDTRLLRLPSHAPPEPRWVWQAVHRDMAGVARVRAVLDFIAEALETTAAL